MSTTQKPNEVSKSMADKAKDFVAVAIDETDLYDLEHSGNDKYIERIYTVYVFDRTERTYLYEAQPSYFLVPAYTEIDFRDGVDEDTVEELHSGYTTTNPEDEHYRHVSQVEKFIADNPDRAHHYGDGIDIEEARGYYQGNFIL